MFGDDPRISIESVISEADTAMYAAKDGGRDGVRVFDPRRGPRRSRRVDRSSAPPSSRRRRAPAAPTASNSLAVEAAGAELRHQRPPGPFGRRQVGEEEQVGAGPGRRHARLRRAAEGAHRDGVERVGDRDAVEAEAARAARRWRSRGRRRRGGREGRVDRGAEHHQVAAERRRRRGREPRRPRAGLAWRGRSAAPRSRCFRGAAPRPGKCLAVAATPPACRPVGEGDRGRGHLLRGRAEAAFGGGDRAARAGDVEDRGEVDVDPELAQVRRRAPALLAAEGGAARAHLRGRGRRGAADPLHQPALLVDHDQQRVAQRRRAADRLQAGDQAAAGGAAGEVVGEEDHAGHPALARSPPPAPAGRAVPPKPATMRSPASCGGDSVLATARLPRRRAPIAERGAEGEGRDREAGQDAPAPRRRRRALARSMRPTLAEASGPAA